MQGAKAALLRHPAVRVPAAPAQALPFLPRLPMPTPALALLLSLDQPLAPLCMAVLRWGAHSCVPLSSCGLHMGLGKSRMVWAGPWLGCLFQGGGMSGADGRLGLAAALTLP